MLVIIAQSQCCLFFSKIFEKIMYKRLNSYLLYNNFLTNNQFGFKEQHSTSMAILQLVDQIATEIDHGNLTIGVFIDLSKAFDTINHNILIDKLSLYGIRGNCLNWIRSYLYNRRQYVYLNEVESDMLPVNCGVPQGSTLGPLLFIVYINDIVNVSRILQLILFADDTNIFLSGPKIDELCITLNTELSKLSRWFKLNKLSLNIKKTNFILFKSKKKGVPTVPNIVIDGFNIDMVDNSKFLGIVINSSLDWTDHIRLINRKVSKTLGILRYLKNKLPESILRSLYYTLVNPYYDYGNIIWAVKNTVVLQKLFLSQKKAVRIITNSSWCAHTEPLFHKLGILKLEELHKLQVGCFMYKIYNSYMPSYFCNMFCANADLHSYNTRQANDYHITMHRTSLLKCTIRIAGPLLWNSLNCTLRSSNTIHSFRRLFKKMLLFSRSVD